MSRTRGAPSRRSQGPFAALATASRRLARSLREGARDARKAWSWKASAWVAAYLLAAILGPVVLSPIRLGHLAAGLYVALAAVGLNYAVGLGGMASLGQGAFVGTGAFVVALLTARAGWAPGPATLTGTAVAAAAGLAAGAGAVRLRGPFVAVSTWVLSWLFAFGLAAFPSTFGGSQGLAVGRPPGPNGVLPGGELTTGGHFQAGLALLALALLGFAALRRGPSGLSLAANRQSPAAAAALGIRPERAQLAAFALSAAIGGLAGALSVQLAGIADAGAYGPLLSVELFVAVLIGGEGTVLGPVVGAMALAVIPPLSRALGSATGTASDRVEGVVAAALLFAGLLAGRAGIAGLAARRRRTTAPRRAGAEGPHEPVHLRGAADGPAAAPALQAEGLVVRFGGLVAVDRVSIEVRAGEIHALIGPNGSGKSTVLRLLSGAIPPDAGSVRVGERELGTASVTDHVRAGVVRTLQRTAVAPELTARRHVELGAAVRRRTGTLRAFAATPQYRAEARRVAAAAQALLVLAGLESSADRPVGSLDGAEQRLVAILTALAAAPSVLLLDEPAAGMSSAARERLRRMLEGLRDDHLAIVLVEHDLRLVQAVADTVTVLDAGKVIAHGSPAAVAADPEVARAYLGPPRTRRGRTPRTADLYARGSRPHNSR